MKLKNIIYASDIKGYCPVNVCWQFLHDISAQLEQIHDRRSKYGTISLNNIQIQGKNFNLIKNNDSSDSDSNNDVWMLATATFELILGTPIFNGIGKIIQSEKTPIPSLPGKEFESLNKLINRCIQKDVTKRPKVSEILGTASKELKKTAIISRKSHIQTNSHKTVQHEEYDKKWPEHITNFKQSILCLLMIIGSTTQIFSQTTLDENEEKYTIKLIDTALMLRNNNQQSWNAAQHEFSTILRLFTMMDELQDINNDCALINKNVKSFGLNRMIKRLKENKTTVQNTGKGLLDGADSRFNYSIYEKGIKKGRTATYSKLTGRNGKQIFIIIPYTHNQPYETELRLSNKHIYKPTHKDPKGITYYSINTNEGPAKEDSLILKIINKDTENNRSFVIINHNYRNKK